MPYTRYAVYYAPAPGPLADFTASWLGWDPVLRVRVAHPDTDFDMGALVADPARYGFHGTLKPPFRLACGRTEADLLANLTQLAQDLAPVTLPGLSLEPLGPFLALRPTGDHDALDGLAARLVRDLDPLRAPLTPEDRARRNPGALTPRQIAHLDRWGYPYVMEEFRFHLTLTGKLGPAQMAVARDWLAPRITPLLPRPFVIDTLCLFGQAQDGRFHLLHRVALG